jgi:phage terminase large subunit-like protein
MKRNWTDDYIEELAMFPSGKFSDQVDATSMAYNELLKRQRFQQEDDPIQPAIQVVN